MSNNNNKKSYECDNDWREKDREFSKYYIEIKTEKNKNTTQQQ